MELHHDTLTCLKGQTQHLMDGLEQQYRMQTEDLTHMKQFITEKFHHLRMRLTVEAPKMGHAQSDVLPQRSSTSRRGSGSSEQPGELERLVRNVAADIRELQTSLGGIGTNLQEALGKDGQRRRPWPESEHSP